MTASVRQLFSTLKHLLQTGLVDLVDRLARARGPTRPQTLLVVCTEAIGDYLLFRNFIVALARSERYRGYAITLCGNGVFRELAEGLDGGVIADFIWLERDRFRHEPRYRFRLVRELGRRGFAVALYPAYSRNYYWGDTIVRASGAPVRLGSAGDATNSRPWQKRHADRFYSQLLDAVPANLFEFARNREFCAQLIGAAPLPLRPTVERTLLPTEPAFAGRYAVLFPGAGERFRQWSPARFAAVAAALTARYGLTVVVAGSAADRPLAEAICRGGAPGSVVDLTGRTPLCGLARLLAGATLLVANETGAVHLAVAVGTPFVCISNGNQLGRFAPYPPEIFTGGRYLFPPAIGEALRRGENLGDTYRYRSPLDINDITTDEVLKAIEQCVSPS